MRAEQVLTGLNDAQARAVVLPAGPVAITAGAGSGKTRTVTARVAYRVASGQLPPAAILAVTHSTRAAGAMRDALRRYPVADLDRVATRTIHAAALNQLKYFWATLGLPGDGPKVCSDQLATVRDIATSMRLRLDPPRVAALVAEIAWAKTTLTAPQGYAQAAAGRRCPVPTEVAADIFARYEKALHVRGLLDHTDLLTRAASLISEHPSVAREVRRRAQFLVVDEYQDTDPAQQQLLDAWLGAGTDITVVGDPRQAIYAFKGADPALLATFPDRYPGAMTVELTQNYRSTPQVLSAANCLASALPGLGHHAPLAAQAGPGPVPRVRMLPDTDSEDAWVAAQVTSAVRSGLTPGEVAVLVRDNARGRRISDLLEDAQVPSWVSGGTRFFDAPEITAIRTQMRTAVEHGFDQSGASLLRLVLASSGFDRATPPPSGTAAAPVWRARRALLAWVEALPAAELLGASHLLTELDRAAASGHHPGVDAVFVGTVHAAKGLEFDAVYTLGWDETWRANGQEANLAYVALTRARRHLTLTWAAQRGGRPVAISGLVAAAGFVPVDERTHMLAPAGGTSDDAAAARSAGARRPRSGAGECRRCHATLPPAAARLRACQRHLTGDAAAAWSALVAWRADQALLSGVPPYRVLSDAAALALIAAAPTTLAALGAVPGVGPATVARHGHDVLSLLRPVRSA